MILYRYIGRTSKVEICDDCEGHNILRVYETTSGYLRICPECARILEEDLKTEGNSEIVNDRY